MEWSHRVQMLDFKTLRLHSSLPYLDIPVHRIEHDRQWRESKVVYQLMGKGPTLTNNLSSPFASSITNAVRYNATTMTASLAT